VVAIDLAISSEEDSDETGIVAASLITPDEDISRDLLGLGAIPESEHFAVVADESGRYTPNEWAQKAIDLYYELDADRIVYEKNQGGDMIPTIIRNLDPNVPLQGVTATKSKKTRAEPVSAFYEQRRGHHVGAFPELEDEQTTWVPGEESPSRMDALVWAIWALLIDDGVDFEISEPIPGAEGLAAGIMEKQW